MTKGLFTRREEDPDTRKILEGATTFRLGLHVEISVRVLTVEKEYKIKNWRLPSERPAAIFLWFVLTAGQDLSSESS